MSRSTLRRWARAGSLGAALLASTACAALLEGIAEEVASDPAPSAGTVPSGPEGLDLAAARSGADPDDDHPARDEAERGYQSAPTIDWTLYRYGSPFSISRTLFEQPRDMGPTCRPAPFGLLGAQWIPNHPPSRPPSDLSRAGESVSRPIADTGRFERDMAAGAVSFGALFVGDRNELAARYIASAARLGHQGHVCNESLFVSVWWGTDRTALTLLR